MALRNQPYIPLYVQDVLTDEKLIECSAEAHGIYFRLLCLLHKQEKYGKFELKAKYKQNESKINSFAEMLVKQMPFTKDIIEKSLIELLDERVLYFEGDCLCQKRMIKDSDISEKRASSGSTGGKKGRNSGTKRYYNEKGFLYLIYDKDDKNAFKVGISAEPEKRIKGIIRKTGRQNLAFRKRWNVSDMGESEQSVLDYFDDIRDGEWIFGEYSVLDIENQINNILLKQKQIISKTKPNSEYENENVIDIPFELNNELFIENWKILISMPKWEKKPLSAIQKSIDKIKKYDIDFAIELVEDAISGNYQGLCFPTTELKYKQWKKDKDMDFDSFTDEQKDKYKAKIWNDLFNSTEWIKLNMRYLSISELSVKTLLRDFLNKIIADESIYEPLCDVKKHFVNWAKKQSA